MKLWGQVSPLALFVLASGLLFCGCQTSNPSTSSADLAPPLPTLLAASAISAATRSVVAPPPPPPLTWRWECFETPLDGCMTTGIESSTNLAAWQLEAEWPVTTVSNSWTEPDRSPPVKFYRAFIK